MRIADAVEHFRQFIEHNNDMWDGEYIYPSGRHLLPTVDKRTRWDFHDRLEVIIQGIGVVTKPDKAECLACELFNALSLEYPDEETDLPYVEIFFAAHAWGTIRGRYEAEKRDDIDRFFYLHIPELGKQYIGLVNEAVIALSDWESLDQLLLVERVASLQRLLDFPVYGLRKEEFQGMCDAVAPFGMSEIRADNIVDDILDSGIDYYESALRAPECEIMTSEHDSIISRTPYVGSDALRRRYLALRESAMGLRYLLESDKKGVWGQPGDDFYFKFTWNPNVDRQWCISANSDRNRLFNTVSLAEFVQFASTCDTTNMLADFCTELQGYGRDGQAEWGLGEFVQILETQGARSWTTQNPIHAMALMHFMLPFVVGGLQSSRVKEAAKLLGEHLPRVRALLSNFAGCDIELVNRLLNVIEEKDLPHVPFGVAFHVLESIRRSQAINSPDLETWASCMHGQMALDEIQRSRMHALFQKTASEIQAEMRTDFAASHYSDFGFIATESCKFALTMSVPQHQSGRKKSPSEFAELMTFKWSSTKNPIDFDSDYRRLSGMPEWENRIGGASRIWERIDSRANDLLSEIEGKEMLDDRLGKKIDHTQIGCPEIVRVLIARRVIGKCALQFRSDEEVAKAAGYKVGGARAASKEESKTKHRDTTNFRIKLEHWFLSDLDFKHAERYTGFTSDEVRYLGLPPETKTRAFGRPGKGPGT